MITKWRMLSSSVGGARGELRSSKLPQSSAGGGDARRQRKETEAQPEEPVVTRTQRKSQIAENEQRGEELGRRRVEDLRESHSAEQSDRKALPTAGERSTANSRREEHRQQQARRAPPTESSTHVKGRDKRDRDTSFS